MTTTSQTPALPQEPGARDATTAQLVTQLAEQVSRLVRDEVALAKLEMTQKGKQFGIGAALVAIAAVFGFFGAGAALVTIGFALAIVLSGWLSALIVAALLLAGAGTAALAGLLAMKKGAPPVPTNALASIKLDLAALKERRIHG